MVSKLRSGAAVRELSFGIPLALVIAANSLIVIGIFCGSLVLALDIRAIETSSFVLSNSALGGGGTYA